MKKVLVVDDNLMAQELISDWLITSCAIKVLLACDVSEALLCLEDNLIDFIICDYEMPGGKGLLVLNYLKEKMLPIPFILFTGRYEVEVPIVFPLIVLVGT